MTRLAEVNLERLCERSNSLNLNLIFIDLAKDLRVSLLTLHERRFKTLRLGNLDVVEKSGSKLVL